MRREKFMFLKKAKEYTQIHLIVKIILNSRLCKFAKFLAKITLLDYLICIKNAIQFMLLTLFFTIWLFKAI